MTTASARAPLRSALVSVAAYPRARDLVQVLPLAGAVHQATLLSVDPNRTRARQLCQR